MRFLKADILFDGKKRLPQDSVLVIGNDHTLKDIISETQVEKGALERFEGIITPGFVNAHCHLELSHLKSRIPQHTGLPGFAKQVIIQRNKTGKEEIAAHMNAADADMWLNGIVAVGDISNGSDSFAIKAQSPVFYHTFVELIGLNPANKDLIFHKGLELLEELKQRQLSGSLAPHAPYSTSLELIKKIADQDQASLAPFSIHNQESEDELKFLEGKPSGFEELYKFLGLDLSWYQPPGLAGLQLYAAKLSAITPSLIVHNTFITQNDLTAAKEKNCYWCFCPGANLYIENRLPDLSLFSNELHKICIGTDSLASNTQLSVVEECNLLLQRFGKQTFQASDGTRSEDLEGLSFDALLSAITSNAAAALGISDRFGSFIPGKNTGLNLLRFTDSSLQFIKKIT